ncbi:MAG: heme exporter protein CcmB [Fimbriimonadaceae bacterium]|nr:heme exporter protein CcmB [Fimbriimonadaceae bacterium]
MAPPNSNWARSIASALRKEWSAEIRARHGFFSATLFGLLTVVAVSLAGYYNQPSGEFAALLLVLAVLFSVTVSVPRVFLAEDELGTMDTLRVIADPYAAYVGKVLYSLASNALQSILLTILFIVFAKPEISNYGYVIAGPISFSLAVASGVAFCSALVLGATNRWTLALVVSLPVCLPLVFLGVAGIAVGFGVGAPSTGNGMIAIQVLASIAWLALGTIVAGQLWRLDRSP